MLGQALPCVCVCVACRLIPWAKVGQESLALTQLPA